MFRALRTADTTREHHEPRRIVCRLSVAIRHATFTCLSQAARAPLETQRRQRRQSERELNADPRGTRERRMEVDVVYTVDWLTGQARRVEIVNVRHVRVE